MALITISEENGYQEAKADPMDLESRSQQPAGISLDHLRRVAEEAMVSRGLSIHFSAEAMGEVQLLGGPIPLASPNLTGLRSLAWASIDNEDTREATVTGKNPKNGVFVKVADPPIEGKLVGGHEGLDLGDKVGVELYRVDPAKGFIDFRAGAGS